MDRNFLPLYDALFAGVDSDAVIRRTLFGRRWAMTETPDSLGLAMATPGETVPPLFADGLDALSLRRASEAVMSWNLREASLGLAAANAFYNTPARIEALGAAVSPDVYSTVGIDLHGLTVGIIGHMHGPEGLREQAKAVYIMERVPQPGDYPDAACDWLLPRCDLVLITGSSLINKTLPHLLSLCPQATTILTGPSVPLCPALLDFGLDRIAGMAVTDRGAMAAHVRENRRGSPYPYGQSFLLMK
ncbi:MAG: DUF364 domain-containing protein [Oscillospiraceae bacterium]|nr:DUF364 domain-containing protein [Oscillospiraceae bacterium]